MAYGLNLNVLPCFCRSSFRHFMEGEKHITRTYADDVLVMVFDGVLRFTENHRPIEVHQGEYYIQRHGLLQEGIRASIKPQYYYIEFNSSNYCDSVHSLPIRGEVNVEPLLEHFKNLDILQRTNATAVECNYLFYRILSKLVKPYRNTEKNQVIMKSITPFINDLQHPFSLDELQELCGYSKNQIINIFKSETGMTPLLYVTKIRLDAAKQLLSNSKLSATQIAEDCGFGSYVNLYKAFEKLENVSPIDWRKRSQSIID